MIEISNLTKTYGAKKALDSLSFTADKGEILGLLGPNGAGKSTTMNIITGYISCTSGIVKIDGYDVLEEPKEVKKRIGYLPEQPPLYTDMVVLDYLRFVYDLKKIKEADKKAHIIEIMKLVGINTVSGRKIANLSKGYKQRVGLAAALLGNPPVLILDEPTVGLDPKQIIEIRSVIKRLGEDRTIILSSHILSEISAVCDRVVIINEGKIVVEDTTDNLMQKYSSGRRLMLRVAGEKERVEEILLNIVGIKSVTYIGSQQEGVDFEVETDIKIEPDFNKQLFFIFAENGMPILMQKEEESSLEDIFIELTNKSDRKNETEEMGGE
jgi:ABC-2 type transport system ATP-binding protein